MFLKAVCYRYFFDFEDSCAVIIQLTYLFEILEKYGWNKLPYEIRNQSENMIVYNIRIESLMRHF